MELILVFEIKHNTTIVNLDRLLKTQTKVENKNLHLARVSHMLADPWNIIADSSIAAWHSESAIVPETRYTVDLPSVVLVAH